MYSSKHTGPTFRASDELEMFDRATDDIDVLILRLELKIAKRNACTKRAARLRAAYPPNEPHQEELQ